MCLDCMMALIFWMMGALVSSLLSSDGPGAFSVVAFSSLEFCETVSESPATIFFSS